MAQATSLQETLEAGTNGSNGIGGGGSQRQDTSYYSMDHTHTEEEDRRWGPAGLRESLERYRWGELLVLLVILLLAYKGVGRKQQHWQYVPAVTQVLPGGATIVLSNNTAFSYPLKFGPGGRLECPPTTLESCGPGGASAADEPCCAFLTTGEGPHQTVPVSMLAGLVIVLPLLLLLLRHALLQKYHLSKQRQQGSTSASPSAGTPSSTHSLRDVLVGFFFAVAMTQGVTNSIKGFVSHPRPNHYALLIFATLSPSPSKAAHYAASAWESWPSGHCSISMTTCAFLAMVFLKDLKEFAHAQKELRAVLVFVAIAPVYLALYVACTRVHDYFHSAGDSITGMSIGLLLAMVAFFHVIPANTLPPTRPNKPLKYF